MKRNYIAAIILVLGSMSCCLAGPRDTLWQEVYNARNRGLPKTAITYLDQIIPAAIQDQAWAEATKAVCLKVVYQSQIEGYRTEEKITRLQPLIDAVPEPMRPCMEVILGHWYGQYFLENRWRFLSRTATSQPPGQDITTWDLATILKEIDKHYTNALSAEEFLKTVPIQVFDELIEKGTVPDAYRPTLFDFVVFEILGFYSRGEMSIVRPQDAYDLPADSPIFDPVEQFLAWQPQAVDQDSVTIKAIRLYQSLLRFHLNDPDPTALIDADLNRLRFGYNRAVGPDKTERYIAALKAFAQRWPWHEISAMAIYYWASQVYAEGDPLAAYHIAQKGMDAFAKSIGGQLCYNLIQDITAKSLDVATERTWSRSLAQIQVRYKNITDVHLRLVPFDVQLTSQPYYSLWYLTRDQLRALLKQEPVRSWSVALPQTADYRQRTVYLTAPSGLEPGFYWLIASSDANFTEEDNVVSYTAVCVTDLALVTRSYGLMQMECLVVEADTGLPIPGARVSVWQWYWDQEKWLRAGIGQTDANGLAGIQWEIRTHPGSGDLITVEHNNQRLITRSLYYGGYYDPTRAGGRGEQTFLFTDRAIYRPGQTIMYKGICVGFDHDNANYKTLAGRSVTVALWDANGQLVARQTHMTNDYGSFSGSFTAPDDRLLGVMYISVLSGPHGGTTIRVEEYKRPTFMVQLDQPQDQPRLGGPVLVTGRAVAYTGAPIDCAQVRWRVERQNRLPFWCRWYVPASGIQAIAYGSGLTSPDGAFSIEFQAKPDLSIPESLQPVFEFAVYVDVTDSTGETRSRSLRIPIGYTTMEAEIQASQWLTPDKPVQLAIRTLSIAGEGEPASGILKVYRLQQPQQVARPSLFATEALAGGPSDPNTWELAEQVYEGPFQTDGTGRAIVEVPLPAGSYRAVLSTQDRFGIPVTAMLSFHVIDPAGDRFPIRLPFFVAAPTWVVEPGWEFICLWGTGYQTGQAFVEVECAGKLVHRFWTGQDLTQYIIRVLVTEQMRGGFTLRITYVRENRAYLYERIVDVPWRNKDLSIRWEHFRSLLEPGQYETWSLVIQGPDAKAAVAEILAAMYDASLEQFITHSWYSLQSVLRREQKRTISWFENTSITLQYGLGSWYSDYRPAALIYRTFTSEVEAYWSYSLGGFSGAARGGDADATETKTQTAPTTTSPTTEGLDLTQYSVRKDLRETSFFYPHLISDKDGLVRIEFTIPEALTQWRFMALAHDRQLRSGYITDTAVTAKELMVQPNPPRFVREGDVIEFTIKVSNQSATRQTGKVMLSLSDAWTGQSMDALLGNTTPVQYFDIPSGRSQAFSWRLTIPDGCGVLVYRAIAVSDRLSDGQEAYLPVLSRRVLVIESMPIDVRGPQTKQVDFASLLQSGQSETLRHQSLTVQVVSQPAWYAVMALPYLMDSPHWDVPAVFNCLYANALARHIANSNPKIRRVFDLWKGTAALDSPLDKDQDLKDLLLQETPWVRQAQDESQARRNVGILFDKNRLDQEISRLMHKLSQTQCSDGLWPWIEGGRGSEYITLLIVTGFGRLRHLGVLQLDMGLALKAIDGLDAWVDRWYRYILERGSLNDNHLTPTTALYLYGRSFFLADRPIPTVYRPAIDYWLYQARRYWTSQWRQSQAHLALGLKRFGDLDTPQRIMASIKEFSVSDEELGMFWRDTERSWFWYRTPIETQAMMVEALDEVSNDWQEVEDCKVWLLKQKQTQDWGTNRATADAVYALLLRGQDLLASSALLEIALNGQWVQPGQVEVGTGFYEERWAGLEIRPQMGHITVKKTDEGISWASVHWQYLEDMSKVGAYEGTPLRISKTLYVKKATEKGQVLYPVTGPLAVGDELVTRIEVRVDRDMEYVHMKDQRPSGCEPVNVLSGHRFQDGLVYYQTTRDAATHFFFENLPKGSYVFEYNVRVQHKGRYQAGIATIQCMYAPEFNSHSQGFELEVQ